MAREGTKAHQLSLQSGELPMASSAAIAGIAEALRRLNAAVAAGELGGGISAGGMPSPAAHRPHARGMQFAVADVEWWRSPWPGHPLLQGVMQRIPAAADAEHDDTADDDGGVASARSTKPKTKLAAGGARKPATAGSAGGGAAAGGDGAAGVERVEAFLKERLSVWQQSLPLQELGLDSLDLVQLRNGFQKAFKLTVPMATFTNAQQTLAELIGKLAAKV